MAELNKKIFEGACENYHGYKVSMFSFWEDPEWIFSEESSNGGPVKIYWKVILGDGSELTDDKNWQLLDACKRFIWSLHVTPPRGQGHTSASRKPISLRINFSRLYALLKWMTTADVNCFSFSALTSIDIDDYIVHIIQHLKISTGEEPIQKTLSGLLSPISLLYLQRRKLPDAVEVEPFDGYSAFKYATKLTNNKGNKIPYMPDEIAKPIISSAVKEVQGSAPKVIEFSEFLLPYYYEFEDGLINKKKEDCFKGKAGDLRWYLGKNAEKHWCDIIEKLNSLEIPHQLSKKVEVQKLKLLHTKLINEVIESSSACILATVGLRASELIHLDINCWEKFESIDGLLNIHVINGITFKLETGPREATWSAGATEMCREVEVDKEKLPIAIEAIKTVTRLLAPWRDAILCETLFLTPPQLWLSTADQKGRNKYSRMTTGLLNKRLKTFSKRVELPYEWNISSHQFRKTFARFVAKLDKKALGALAEQYQHQALLMTDEAYIGRNFELTDLIGEHSESKVAIKLNTLLMNDYKLGGEVGKRIEEYRPIYRGMKLSDRQKELQWIISDSNLLIHEDDFGLCIVEKEDVSCREDEKVPIYLAKCPSKCVGCGNFTPSSENTAYWKNRKLKNEELLILMTGASDVRKSVPKRIIRECEAVLEDIS